MVPAYEYDRDELVMDLAQHGPRQLRRYYSRRGEKRRALIHFAVDASTYRAFSGLDKGPSKIFRPWARGYLSHGRMCELSEIADQTEFDAFLEEALKNLSAVWLDQGGKELGYGPGMKLLNLLLKSVLRSAWFTVAERERLIPLLHVPLDKYSLAAIRQISRTGEFGPVVRIPRNARMGFVSTRDLYDDIQQIMRGVAAEAGVPPICVDLLAWDLAHS